MESVINPRREVDGDAYNASITGWDKSNTKHLKDTLNRLNVGKTGRLLKSVSGRVKKIDGLAEIITKKIDRSGVFVEKGVGRGYPIESIRSNRTSISAKGGKGREPKPWFNSTIDRDFPALADAVNKYWADASLRVIKIA